MIELNRVIKIFSGNHKVLDEVSFQVTPGETTALVGESGCGKSVLLYIIAGLLPPTSGTVRLGSQKIGMLFQQNALFDSLSVSENLALPLEELTSLGEAQIRERVHAYLEYIGLLEKADAPINALSGGMQKRLALARALITEPDILLCDSPTAGLDPITARQIMGLLVSKKWNVAGATIIATNDETRILPIVDRIFHLLQGKLEVTGKKVQRNIDEI